MIGVFITEIQPAGSEISQRSAQITRFSVLRFPGDDVDNPGYRIGAVKCRGGPVKDLNSFGIGKVELPSSIKSTGIQFVDLNPIDHQQDQVILAG